jgi:hypothetical protein
MLAMTGYFSSLLISRKRKYNSHMTTITLDTPIKWLKKHHFHDSFELLTALQNQAFSETLKQGAVRAMNIPEEELLDI